ncbi:MAG: glycosyltransferase family 2 protein [Pseudomonadota bacterium]
MPDFCRYNPRRPEKAKISIVTIARNEQNTIKETLDSVINQTEQSLEYIVIDGSSTDATLKIITDYKGSIDVIISEADDGIYSAMNKAVDLCRGEWILFMNAGDKLASSRTLEFFDAPDSAGIAYGDARFGDASGALWKNQPAEALWRGMIGSHQSTFVRRELLEKYRFDETNRVVADYGLLVRCQSSGANFHELNYTISIIEPGGLSAQRRYRRTWERFKIAFQHYPKLPISRAYAGIFLGFVWDDLVNMLNR